MATHWEIPWTEEPGSLQSMESHKRWTRLSNLNNNKARAWHILGIQ